MNKSLSRKWVHASLFALLAALGNMVLGIVSYLFGPSLVIQSFSLLIFWILLIFALRDWKRKRRESGLTYGQACGYSFLVTLFYSLLVALWAVLFFHLIAPEIIAGILAELVQLLIMKRINISQYNLSVNLLKPMLDTPVLYLSAFLVNMLFLSLFSLITAVFFRQNPPSPINQANIPQEGSYSPY